MTPKKISAGSLRNRLIFTLIGGAAVLTILLFFVMRNYATQLAQEGQDNILKASVTSILDSASIRDGQVDVDIPYASFSMLSTLSDDRVFYAIFHDDTFLSGYEKLVAAAPAADRNILYQTIEFQGEPVRLVTARRTLVGATKRTQIRVSLAQTQGALSETLGEISRNTAIFGAGFFTLAILLSIWATSSTIGQLNRLSNSVTRRGPHDLSPFEKPVPVEMHPLVTSLNSLMRRLDQSLARSEDFIAEAAHRVRTPLATVRSYAEATLQRVEKEENRQAMRSMVRAIDESSRAAGQLLDHAMITFRADHLVRQDIDLVELIDELVMRMTPIAEMKDLRFEVQSDAKVMYSGDPVLIQNAVRNLIDNALKYSHRDAVVEVLCTKDASVRIEVKDRGVGFLSSELETLAERFQRGQNVGGTIGSGLGLTIAKDVAEAHGGSLNFSNRLEGGACATLLL